MTPKIATVLSLAGVLTAGSAAALVNTQVLSSSADSGTTAAVAAPTTSTTFAPMPTAPATAPATAPTSTDPAAPVQALNSYAVGESGVVVLDSTGGALAIVSATPNAGWTVTFAQNASPTAIGVVFASDTVEVTFAAELVDGQVVTQVGSRNIGPAATAQPPRGDDDDDHEGDDDGEEHEGDDRGDDDD